MIKYIQAPVLYSSNFGRFDLWTRYNLAVFDSWSPRGGSTAEQKNPTDDRKSREKGNSLTPNTGATYSLKSNEAESEVLNNRPVLEIRATNLSISINPSIFTIEFFFSFLDVFGFICNISISWFARIDVYL